MRFTSGPILISLCLLAAFGLPLASDRDPALDRVFDGAEGFGVETPAGRGGDTVRVTTLEDSGEGSLRSALERFGRRIVVFDVAGTIALERRLVIKWPYVSILGQTAPSPGITLRDHSLHIATSDVLVQHIKVRVGDLGNYKDPATIRGISMSTVRGGSKEVFNVVVDHCTVSWTIDQALDTWPPDVHDITVSNCVFAEALNNSLHPKGPHAFGPMFGYNTKRIAFLSNLIAHCSGRTPDIQGGTETLVVNNVIYDPLYVFIAVYNSHKTEEQPVSTIIGNVCIKGPSGRGRLNKAVWIYSVESETTIYVRDNLCEDFSADPLTSVEFKNPNTGEMLGPIRFVDEPPVMCEPLTIRPSEDVLDYVLANAGARPWDRDRHDRRIINQVRNRTGGLIDSQEDVGGW